MSERQTIEKGEVSLRLGDYAMAIHFFKDVLSREPDNFDARLGMGKALIQNAFAAKYDSLILNSALVHLGAARTIKPERSIEPLICDAWVIHSRGLLKSYRDTIGALKALSYAIDYNPRSVEALNLAGIIYFRLGEPTKSLLLFKQALASDTSRPFTYFNMGMIFWSSGAIADAYKLWRKAVQLAPEDQDIVYWYSISEKKLKTVAYDSTTP